MNLDYSKERARSENHRCAECDVGDDMVAEIERLRAPFQNVDAKDWDHLFLMLPYSGHGQFWKMVMHEMRAALRQS